jgi:hypothetical protein
MMVKVRAVGKEREEMKRMADIFRGRIIDVTEKSYTIELTGDQSKNDAFLEAIDRSAILETVRTGSSGIGRGERNPARLTFSGLSLCPFGLCLSKPCASGAPGALRQARNERFPSSNPLEQDHESFLRQRL